MTMNTRTTDIKRSQIDEIIGKTKFNNNIYYLFKWKGKSPEEATWERSSISLHGSLDPIRKQFNISVKDKSFPYVAEKYAHLSDTYLAPLQSQLEAIPQKVVTQKTVSQSLKIQQSPKRIAQKLWGKQRRGNQMYYLVQWKNSPIDACVWVPRMELEKSNNAMLTKFLAQNRWQDEPFVDQRYWRELKQNGKSKYISKKEKLQAKKQEKTKKEYIDQKQHENQFEVDYVEEVQVDKKCKSQKLSCEKKQSLNKKKIVSKNDKVQNPARSEMIQQLRKHIVNDIKQRKRLSQTKDETSQDTVKVFSSVESKKIFEKLNKQENSESFELDCIQQRKLAECEDAEVEYQQIKKSIKKIAFLKKVSKNQRPIENLFLVTFKDNDEKEMTSSELRRKHSGDYIKYLQILCENYKCFEE